MDKVTRYLSVATIALGMGLLLSACNADAGQGFREQRQDMESYSLGYQTGQNLKSQKVNVDLDIYLAGIRDGLAGKKSELTQDEMRAVLAEMGKRIQANLQAESAAKAEKNLAEGRAFLAENKMNKGVRELPSGLQYQVLKEGAGKLPRESDTIKVDYRGTTTDGTEFASSYKLKKPFSTTLSNTIPGWKEALQLMKEGSRWKLYIPPELAYGERGTNGIEPNSTLIFEVELIAVTPAAKGSGAPKQVTPTGNR